MQCDRKNRPGTQSLATPHFPEGSGHLTVTEHNAQSKAFIGADGLIRKELSYPLRTLTDGVEFCTVIRMHMPHVVPWRRSAPSLFIDRKTLELTDFPFETYVLR